MYLIACLTMVSCIRDEAAPASRDLPGRALILYSSLPGEQVRAIANAYTATNGVPVQYVLESGSVLLQKLSAKEQPNADLLLASGIGELVSAVESDVLRPTRAEAINKSIPARLRDPDGYWFGMSVRALAIVYDPRSVDVANLSDYASLSHEAWYGRICLLSSAAETSHTLVAALIAGLGERQAERVVRRWQTNLARPVFSTEHELLLAIEAGHCQAGIATSDAVARFFVEGRAKHLSLHWPSGADGGVQLNLIGAGVTRHATNPAEAARFLEWLATDDGQRILSTSGRNFPANPQVPVRAPLSNWAGFERAAIDSVQLGYLIPDALRLVERARYP